MREMTVNRYVTDEILKYRPPAPPPLPPSLPATPFPPHLVGDPFTFPRADARFCCFYQPGGIDHLGIDF